MTNNKCETCDLNAGNIGASIPLMPCGAERCVKEKRTNFEAIQSPERLAELICNNTIGCVISDCPHWDSCKNDKVSVCVIRRDSIIRDYKAILEFLKKEVEEE